MSLGQAIRRLAGPWEVAVSDAYRSLYVDLAQFVSTVREVAGFEADADLRVLEVGCGEGAVVEELARHFPRANLLGIDLTPRVGRLYRGRKEGVEFRTTSAEELLSQRASSFDLVVLCDVLHHVPPPRRQALLQTCMSLAAVGGYLAVKDWERSLSLAHACNYFVDRFITGDRIRYFDRGELKELVSGTLPRGRVVAEFRVPPRANNCGIAVRL